MVYLSVSLTFVTLFLFTFVITNRFSLPSQIAGVMILIAFEDFPSKESIEMKASSIVSVHDVRSGLMSSSFKILSTTTSPVR